MVLLMRIPPQKGVNMTTKNVRVVVAQHNEVVRSALRQAVEKIESCKVVAEAPCGLKAMEVIEHTPADLILLDAKLPVVSGLEILKTVRPKVSAKILLCALFSDDDQLKQGLEFGADGIVAIESGKVGLAKAIQNALNGANACDVGILK